MIYAALFPPQGAQQVGMGRALAEVYPEARDVFNEVDRALRQKLSRTIFDGPAEKLNRTENTQPALLATSMAVVRVLERRKNFRFDRSVAVVAGNSLGEYSALCAAGSLSLFDAANLLRVRGRAMQEAVPEGVGAMAALVDVNAQMGHAIAAEAAEGEVCVVSNDNITTQVVLSGHVGAIDRALDLVAQRDLGTGIKLKVSVPAHSPLMKPAADVMREALEEVTIRQPVVPLVANVTAKPVADPKVIRELLVRQMTEPVRWRETIGLIKEGGVTHTIECGQGGVLTGMIHYDGVGFEQAVSLASPEDLEDFSRPKADFSCGARRAFAPR